MQIKENYKIPKTFSILELKTFPEEKGKYFYEYFFKMKKTLYCIGFLPKSIKEVTKINTFLTKINNKKEITTVKNYVKNDIDHCMAGDILFSTYPEYIKQLFHPIKYKKNYEYLTQNFFYFIPCLFGPNGISFQEHKTSLFNDLYNFFEFKKNHYYIVRNGHGNILNCSYDYTSRKDYYSWSTSLGDNNWLELYEHQGDINLFLYQSLVEFQSLHIIEFNEMAKRNPYAFKPKEFKFTLDEKYNPIILNKP